MPMIKLGALFVKQLEKPVVRMAKNYAKDHELFGRLLSGSAQQFNRTEQRVRMRILGWKGEVDVKPLSDSQALDLGAQLLGECLVFGTAVGLITLEYQRSKAKERKKEAELAKEFSNLHGQITLLKCDIVGIREEIAHQMEVIMEELLKMRLKCESDTESNCGGSATS